MESEMKRNMIHLSLIELVAVAARLCMSFLSPWYSGMRRDRLGCVLYVGLPRT